MTDTKNEAEKHIGEKTLKLNDLKDFTVGEIVEKSKRVSQENFESETVLDKYIRQHRGEIEEAKSKNLDNFIHAEREKLTPENSQEAKLSGESSLVSAVENYSNKSVQKNDTPDESERPETTQTTPVLTQQSEKSISEKTESTDSIPDFNHENLTDDAIKIEPEVASILAKEEVGTGADKFDQVNLAGESNPSVSEKDELVQPVDLPPISQIDNEFDQVDLADEVKSENVTKNVTEFAEISSTPPVESTSEHQSGQEVTAEKEKTLPRKNRKTPIIIGICAIVLIAAGATYWATQNSQKPKTISTTQSSSTSKNSVAVEKFKADYAQFFVDKAQTQLKNSEFTRLSTLAKDRDAITDNAALSTAKMDYNNLKAQIDAIDSVNNLFKSSVITDGKLDKAAKIKTNLSSIPIAPKTSNNTLNQLLVQAIDLAKTQKTAAEAKTSTSSSSVTNTSSSKNSAETNTTTVAPKEQVTTNTNTTTVNNTNTTTNSTPTYNNVGLSPVGVALDNSDARVQPQAGLNTSDPAFTWASGIKATVLDKCRARGYITGDNFILVPVAIYTTNGAVGRAGIRSGYYNLYRPDGGYLVTINDQTGYFFGNASGHKLDF